MDLGLKGKTALVTGASRGIGNRIALALAAEGADLCICARTEEAIKTAAAEIAANGNGVEAVVAAAEWAHLFERPRFFRDGPRNALPMAAAAVPAVVARHGDEAGALAVVWRRRRWRRDGQ